MTKTFSTIVGIVFILAGFAGLFAPGLLGAHLSPAHNLIHFVSGALALYFGIFGTFSRARLFCLIFGSVYFLLGVVGFAAGVPGAPLMPGMESMGTDPHLLRMIPGSLELGTVDHMIHVGIGLVFLVSGFAPRAYFEPKRGSHALSSG